MELRVRVTISEHGFDASNGDDFLDGFVSTHADADPVVTQNTLDGTLTVAFTVEADDAFAAGPIAGQVFTDGANASGLPATEIVDVSVTIAEHELETQKGRELQPA